MTSTGNWQPTASLDRLRARANLLDDIRGFFRQAGVLEVETPACSVFATTDPALDCMTSSYTGPGAADGRALYLHTSPEFPMKRLLAAGSGAIYQICKVFRDGEAGRLHNPEFTLLEWYRPGFDHHLLMDEVERMVCSLLDGNCETERSSYGEVFDKYLALDPHRATADELRQCALQQQVPGAESIELPGRDAWLDLLMSHCIEPQLGRNGLCFVYDYPASQASLACIRHDDPPVAERFELYMDGLELANGFHELADAAEQRKRFERDLEKRAESGKPMVPMDEHLLAALENGLPPCAGVALGIDRLLMRLTGASHLDEVLAFPLDRA
ncbi:EF-P lysine aminoacylase EpmA [Solemya velesiana gill symbiont]|uniref:EF-P lysine aminoacylase EpmA n=1 Tax=Solemya velesiana gill symbiont TaxID=1918948 RepID=UPI00267B5EB8